LIDKKIIVPQSEGLFRRFQVAGGDGMNVDKLRRATESCLRHRHTKVILIDEAHHLLMVKGADKQELQFETLKSLANETEARIVLLGTYRLLDIRNHSAQLVRRSKIVQFRRYAPQMQNDEDDFASAIAHCLNALPIKCTDTEEILNDVQWPMLMSVGCIGIATDWLTRALELALAQRQALGRRHLEATALGTSELQTLYREALHGESMLQQIPIEDLHKLAYHSPVNLTARAIKRAHAKPGVRKPTRDPVGSRHVA
jgi:Bacterial TniB protein